MGLFAAVVEGEVVGVSLKGLPSLMEPFFAVGWEESKLPLVVLLCPFVLIWVRSSFSGVRASSLPGVAI